MEQIKKKIYFAGGWFNPQQAEEHERVYDALKQKYDVFNPKIAGIVDSSTTGDHMVNILLGNLNAIKESQLVVVITDGKDMGTIWESGYAYGNAKPIIYYCETLGDKPFNLMLAKTGRVAKSINELLELLNDDTSWQFKNYCEQYKGTVE